MTPALPRSARLRCTAAILGAVLSLGAFTGVPALAAPSGHPTPKPVPAAPDLGPNVTVFSPTTPLALIQSTLDALADQQRDAEMSTARHAVAFLPGTYGTTEHPLQFEVGYYTEVLGLGASPGEVTINGSIEVYNRCLDDAGTSNCLALVNFWRTLSNLSLNVIKTGQDGCRQSANFWAVSQAVSLRRVQVSGGSLSLMDYCTAGPQYASGGFIADSVLPTVVNGSQQQWLIRNSTVGSWSNAVWNQVFSGVTGAPDDATFPEPPYTTVARTALSREKPYLFVDASGRWFVRVPSAQRNSSGVSWAHGTTPGRSVPLSDFFVAWPGTPVARINQELARGRNLLLTPGVYDIARAIEVTRPDTVVLGLGHATLTAVRGATPLKVSGRAGIVVAGVTIDAGTRLSPVLLQVGEGHGGGRSTERNPLTLSDVYFRIGGPHVGKAVTALKINAGHVLVDHTWIWRADHGEEGFTAGESGDTDRWRTNIGRYGLVVNGDDVTITGLFAEHFQRYSTLWNGERGRVVFYQNELAYDPPTQADWTQPDGTPGFPGYKVSDRVRVHSLSGGGVYVYNRNNPSIVTTSGFEVPARPRVTLHHVMTVNLGAGTISHVVNDTGTQADNSNTGTPQFVTDYPTP
ncbi:hypothetical protein [Propionicimonas sp.]|uniref:hypothetical protein n=1 Tax=Propionicimonas sp. TaxID=1955623 RepID=UPI0039E5E888